MAEEKKSDDSQVDGGAPQHPGAGPVPGGSSRTRRRGALPGSEPKKEEDASPSAGGSAPPVGTPLDQQQPAPPADEGNLSITEKPQLPTSKVFGLRVSEHHYDHGNTMVNVLSTQFRLDKRQVGELMIQFLVARRFELYNYVKEKVGPEPVDLDFFTRKEAD